MILQLDELKQDLAGLDLVVAPMTPQHADPKWLEEHLNEFDGWIVGDDEVTDAILERSERLRVLIKWGVGTDNVNVDACRRRGIVFDWTPSEFGQEVSTVAIGYLLALARDLVQIDRGVRDGQWPKPPGLALNESTVLCVGFGDIGQHVCTKLEVFGLEIHVYDPCFTPDGTSGAKSKRDNSSVGKPYRFWSDLPSGVAEKDFIIICCAGNPANRHSFCSDLFTHMKRGVRLVNVSRGSLIDTEALKFALASGQVSSAALDVHEEEPLPPQHFCRHHPSIIAGSHNASNTKAAACRVSRRAIKLVRQALEEH